MTRGSLGSMASEPICSGAVAGQHRRQLPPESSLVHTPPPAAPSHTVLGSSGWHTSEVQRPPMLVGPAKVQRCAPGKAASLLAVLRRSSSSTFMLGSRSGHDTRARNQAARPLWCDSRVAGRPLLACLRGPGETVVLPATSPL